MVMPRQFESSLLPHRAIILSLSILDTGCKPELEGRPSLIDSARVISIRSTESEVKPGTDVVYDVLIAQPVDDASVHNLDWALCLAQKPIADSGPIAPECLQPAGPNLTDLGTRPRVTGTIPADACQYFGPITPQQKPGEPPLRAADPDTTGGYYQPVRLRTEYASGEFEYEVGVTRLECGLPGVTQTQLLTYNKSYRANQNPGIERVTFTPSGNVAVVIDPAVASSVPNSEVLNLEVSWPSCPLTSTCGDDICGAGEDVNSCPDDCTAPKGCEGSEPYVAYDLTSQTLQNRRESMRISWYATDGTFEHDRTGRSEAEADVTTSSNDWTAPSHPGLVRFWLVIRDDRRGENWTSFDLNVE